MDPVVIVFGLGVGILIGLTGLGGGSLMTAGVLRPALGWLPARRLLARPTTEVASA